MGFGVPRSLVEKDHASILPSAPSPHRGVPGPAARSLAAAARDGSVLPPIPAGMDPAAVAVNPVTNKIYVANAISNDITVIDGATNATTTLAAGSQPMAVAVNPVTNKIHIANSISNNVTVIEEQQANPAPPATTIQPLPDNRTKSAAPLFAFDASTTTTGVPVRDVSYQIDTRTGPWQRAVPTQVSGRWQGRVVPQLAGVHILYAYAADGQEATSINTGEGSSPIIGSITAYLFVSEGRVLYLPLLRR
ncbi:MAG TPA: hypothetical protein VGA61_09450 [Anaerolineae bacterium]